MFNLTISEIWNVVRALLDIGIVWAVIFFGLRIVPQQLKDNTDF